MNPPVSSTDDLSGLEKILVSCPPEDRIQKLRTMPYEEYLQTPEWLERRERKLKEADFRCQVCNKDGPLDVHHRTYEHRGNEAPGDLTVLCGDCHALFHGVSPDESVPQEAKSFQDHLTDALYDVEGEYEGKKLSSVRFGLKGLDDRLIAVEPGSVCVIGAEPGMGKTSLALQAVVRTAIEEKVPVAVFSLKMTDRQVSRRMLLHRAKVPLQKIRAKFLAERSSLALTSAAASLAAAPIHLFSRDVDICQIVAQCHQLKTRHGLHLVVVDYLQMIRDLDREAKPAETLRRLKRLALDLGVVVIVLAQLNHEGWVKESDVIERDPDVVLRIEPLKGGEVHEMNIVVRKQRGGQRGIEVPVCFCGESMSFLHREVTLETHPTNDVNRYQANRRQPPDAALGTAPRRG
jgi:replicative DNA helicase